MDFPSKEFFDRLRTELVGAADEFARLGVFDASFAIRVQASPGFAEERNYLFRFELDSCTELTETETDGLEDRVDFVLEAPHAIWCEMLAIGHDKLFRFQQSVQTVFNVAATVAAEGARAST